MPASYSNVLPFAAATPQYEDVRNPVTSLSPGATPADPIVYGPSGAVRILGFDGTATTEDTDLTCQLPNSYLEGSDIVPHIHWCPTTNDAGDVKWQLSYYWQNEEETIPAEVTISVVAAAGGTAWKHQRTDFAAISGAGKKIGSMLMCRLFRIPTDGADTYAHDAGLLEMDFRILIDSAGSRQPEVK